MKKRLAIFFAAIALVLGVSAASIKYYNFISQTIYTESIAHLSEICSRTNRSLHSLVGRNWSTMRMWVPYFNSVKDEGEIETFIEKAKEEVGYTDFYFISREGNYQTINGKKGYLDLKDSLSSLILQKEDVVINSVVPNKPEIMVFAVPSEKGVFKGFEYEAIAITFNNADLVETLEVTSFKGSQVAM